MGWRRWIDAFALPWFVSWNGKEYTCGAGLTGLAMHIHIDEADTSYEHCCYWYAPCDLRIWLIDESFVDFSDYILSIPMRRIKLLAWNLGL